MASSSTMLGYSLSIMVAMIATTLLYPAQAKMMDLSHDLGEDTVMAFADWPKYETQIVFDMEVLPGVLAKALSYSVSEHGGTHIDAPYHFNSAGQSVEQIPLENTIADGIMIDCTEEAAENPVYSLTLQKVKDWEKANGKIPPNSAVVINNNWSHKFSNASLYLNPTDPTDLTDSSTFQFPTVSVEAINFLVDERDINILAIDTMSPDSMSSAFPVHIKLSRKNKLIVENVKDPGQLPAKGFRLHASPAKFIGSTGIQTRVYAIVSEDCGSGDGQCIGCSLLTTLTVMIVPLFMRLLTLL